MTGTGDRREPGQPDPDLTEVTRAGRDDRDAFDVLVRRHEHRLVNYLKAVLGNEADAEDVAQEAFVRAYRGLRRFRGQSTFKTWLFQIATNTARTHVSRRAGRRESPMPGAGEGVERPQAFDPASGEDLEAAVVLRDRLDRALAKLPADQREAVVLRDVEGFDYREIAQLLDVPIGTVESRIFRGRQRLRMLIQAPGPVRTT